jgi:hypothetical protein
MTTPTQVSPVAAPAPDAARLDAARERVVRLLTDRYADDTLTVEAFEARLDRMHALTSAEALDAMARELTAAGPNDVAPRAPAGQSPTQYAPYAPHAPYARHEPYAPARRSEQQNVLAFMASIKRRGAWQVPERLRAAAVMGELVLDLRDAALPPSSEVEVLALMGNVRLIVPPGVDVHFEVTAVMGAADDRSRGVAQAPHAHLRVTGLAFMGEVKVVGG